MSTSGREGWIPELDGLRGIAVLLVVHAHVVEKARFDRFAIEKVGWIGVDLFFVLSGYLITSILLRTRSQPNYWSRFVVRRALRILPLYVVFVLVFAQGWRSPDALGAPFWAFLLFVQNWWLGRLPNAVHLSDITWSLGIEEQYYLLFPFLVAALDLRRLRQVLLVAVIAAPVLRIVCALTIEARAAQLWTFCRMDAIAVGALVAVLAAERRDDLLDGVARAAGPLLVVGVLLASLGWVDRTWFWFVTLGYSGVAAVFAACLVAVCRNATRPWLRSLLASPMLGFVGQISFGLYLLHGPAINITHELVSGSIGSPAASWGAALVYAVLAPGLGLAAAWVSWRLLEQPALRLKDRLAP